MTNFNMAELSELNDDELLDIKNFVEAEMRVRSDLKLTEQAHKLANVIQQIVDLGYIVRESARGDSDCTQYTIEDEKCIDKFHIIPDYAWYDGDEKGHYGYLLEKWNGKKKVWEDITNV